MDLDLSTLAAPADSRDGLPFRVLVVCTGNICRSAYAAALLETRLAALPAGAVEVDSAGTDVNPAVVMPSVIRDAMLALGAEPDRHRIVALRVETVEAADLVLTMTGRQRAAVVRLVPPAASRVQMLTQFARLSAAAPVSEAGSGSPADAMRAATTAAISRRGLHAGADGDIVDPWGRDDAFFRRCIAEIDVRVDVIVRRLLEAGRSAA